MVPDFPLLPRQSDANCKTCPEPSPCNCAANEQCILVNRDCNTCSVNKCVAVPSAPSKSGVSGGAVAGAVIASVIFLVAGLLAFLWFRRRSMRRAAAGQRDGKPEVPARAEDVLNRPDPNEKPNTPVAQEFNVPPPPVYAGTSDVNADPEAQIHATFLGAHNNPFGDNHSIQTMSTGTHSNVIPIGLVGPASSRSDPSQVNNDQTSQASGGSAQSDGSGPRRPVRSPELNLNLEHVNVSNDSIRSGLSAPNRLSYMTTGSYASDFLNEAPVIVTPTRGTVKQVVGVVKAEVIRTPPGGSGVQSANSLTSPAVRRPTIRSPLAASSFGPTDIVKEADAESVQAVSVRSNPFSDEHSPYPDGDIRNGSQASTPTNQSFTAQASPGAYSEQEDDWNPTDPRRPWAASRPTSLSTQAGSVISADIGSATRVQVGLNHLSPNQALVSPGNQSDMPRTPVSAALSTPQVYRMTSAKLVTPVSNPLPSSPDLRGNRGALERQQQRALEELDAARRVSRSSVASGADSLLEGFPFVPPSPISDRPIRTPPRSPLAQQTFTTANNNNLSPNSANNSPTKQSFQQSRPAEEEEAQVVVARPRVTDNDSPLPPPPNRKMLGMSTASQSSTLSSGLGNFPFQIDSGSTIDSVSSRSGGPPSSFSSGSSQRQRASLDTLALTSDLSSYPLGFDRAMMDHFPGPRR